MADPEQQPLGPRFTYLAKRLEPGQANDLAEWAYLTPAAKANIRNDKDTPGSTFFTELRRAKGEAWMTVANVRALYAAADLSQHFVLPPARASAVAAAGPSAAGSIPPPTAAPPTLPGAAAMASTASGTATQATTRELTGVQYPAGAATSAATTAAATPATANLKLQGTEAQIGEWYATDSREVVPAVEMPHVAAINSTMTASLHDYIKNKFRLPKHLKKDFLIKLANDPLHKLKVVGVWDCHFVEFCRLQRWQRVKPLISTQVSLPGALLKRFYAIRPSLAVVDLLDEHGELQDKPFYVLVVAPGRDYLLQYGHMLRLRVSDLRRGDVDASQIEVWHYPRAAEALGTVSTFSEVVPHFAGATVILGYVEHFAARFVARHSDKLQTKQADFAMTSDGMYGYRIFEVVSSTAAATTTTTTAPFRDTTSSATGATTTTATARGESSSRDTGRVVLLGVRHMYWGDIAGRLATLVANAGATCILYAAKCGTMSHRIKIYDTLVIPSQYQVLELQIDQATNSRRSAFHRVKVDNVIEQLRPQQSTGPHLSVPTVTGETFAALADAAKRGFTSIDNELGRMAAAISALPAATRPQFGSVHFATDHVGTEHEIGTTNEHDLANQDKIKRGTVLDRIADLLADVVVEVAGNAGQQQAS